MRKLCALAAASLLLIGFSSAAGAAPVTVTYGFGPGNTVTWVPTPAGSGGTTTLNPGGALVVTYASGVTTLGGAKSGPVTVQFLQAAWTAPFTLIQPVPGMAVAGGLIAPTLSGTISGMTLIPAGIINGTNPPFTFTGTAGLTIANLGAATVFVNGAGMQQLLPGLFANWSIGAGTSAATGIGPTGWIGQEISRTPEPATGMLLLAGLAGLAAFGARRIRR